VSVELSIDRLAKSGDGVALLNGRTVFVEGALPGERVRVALSEQGKVLKGELLEVLQASPSRRVPACPIAQQCGGCSWLHLDEPAQRAAKEEIVTSALEHLGGIARREYELLPTVFGARAMGYRRRATLHAVDGGFGFHGRRSHVKVRVDRCPALVPELEALAARLELPKGVDEVRLLSERGVGVSLHLREPLRPAFRKRAEGLLGQVQSVVLVPPEGQPEVFGDRGLRADHFSQANEEVNAQMVAAAAQALGEGGPALELYAGSGNFTRALTGPVTAVEVSGLTVHLPHVRWIQGDVAKVVKGLLAERAKFERVLLDPPRAGAHGIERWAEGFGASRVIYVACDPASLARDASELRRRGFRPRTLQLFDMFPQTHHVEAVMKLERS
jgi:23S rRNA (uracil1939-C5)-methyltransferase